MSLIGNDWDELLEHEFKKDYYKKLRNFLKNEYQNKKIYPDMHDIYNALKITSYKDTKVVILGQDPYHGQNQANGLAFSVKKGIQTPPSLVNIYKELKNDLNLSIPNNGDLTSWANQGVLLLNTVLTVREKEPNSHKNMGWEILTDKIIALLNEKDDRLVFLLWGNNAKSKKNLIDINKHFILESVHPSPLSASRGFFGCSHFSKTNDILIKLNKTPINWQIDNI